LFETNKFHHGEPLQRGPGSIVPVAPLNPAMATGAIAQDPPLQWGPRDDIYLF